MFWLSCIAVGKHGEFSVAAGPEMSSLGHCWVTQQTWLTLFCVKYAQRGRTYTTIEFMSSDVRSKAAAQMNLVSHDGLRLAPTKRFSCHLQAHLVKF